VGLMGKNFDGVTRLLLGGSLVAAAALISGCMSSPTYGTDKTASAQLMSDVGGILSFSDKKKAQIEYAPRPELVKPAKGDETLPAPQDSVATASNPNWPESPEQRLARLRADADANLDNPNYDSPIVPDMVAANPKRKSLHGNGRADESGVMDVSNEAAQKAEYQKRLQETRQGSSQTRKYLSEPPVDYRQAAADAPTGELGEDEYRKERRLKREARKKSGGFSISDLNPF
jgi:hypothetical protein